MSVYSQPIKSEGEGGRVIRPAVGNRIAAVVAWLVGVTATTAGLWGFLPNVPWYIPVVFGFGSQAFLTWAERTIWKGRPSVIGFGALAIDVLLNAGGIYPYALRLGNTPPVQMIADVLNTDSAVGPVGAMIVAVVLGFLVAAAPEELWTRKE